MTEAAVIGVGVYPAEGESAGYTMIVTIDQLDVDVSLIEDIYNEAFRRTIGMRISNA